jgi:hypothetical protein
MVNLRGQLGFELVKPEIEGFMGKVAEYFLKA